MNNIALISTQQKLGRRRLAKGSLALVGAVAALIGGVGMNATTGAGAVAHAQLPRVPSAPGSSATQVPFGWTQVGLKMAPQGCAAHIVVNVPGGANTTSNLPKTLPVGPYTAEAGQALRAKHPGKVVDRYVSYRSTPGGAYTYEQTRNNGYRQARALIAREAAACPKATFSLIGYSMGADIASRIVNDIAYGRGPISSGRMDSAVLIANPNRSAMAEVKQAGGAPRTDGAFGELPGSYGKLGDRVLEICRRGDIVCDTPRSAAPLTKAFARSAILTGFAPVVEAKATVDRLNPRERSAFYAGLPKLAAGQNIHTNYHAVNGAGQAIGYVDRHLGTAGRNPENAKR